MIKYALYFLLIPVYPVLGTGWNDYEVELGAGYKLVRTNACNVMILHKDHGFIIPSKIVGLGLRKDIITGRVENEPLANVPSIPGYFIVEMETGSVQTGLAEQTWLNALRLLGLKHPPKLRKPSRFFRWNLFINKYWKLTLSTSALLVLSIVYLIRGKIRKRETHSGVDKGNHGIDGNTA